MSSFKEKVLEIVNLIPQGKVASYGQIALYLGVPRAARQVGWTLRQLGSGVDIPWWRVVNRTGRISIDGNLNADRDLQKKLLKADGVEVSDYQVNMEKYRFIPGKKLLSKLDVSDASIKSLFVKF